ncbi:iron-sulfur cluster assembly protein [Rubrobacter indicoceani]|uniref:iron-sulfur cluster assembly protein n=1 Tax=Rubrobacter indicoceani TaxID=2051957 RepID=UPI000E5BEF36|nr:iron-sulfur cluster assembly protein [Rubrobacter indicoceani]
MTITKERVLGVLAGVRDPELDEPVTTLGFISDVTVEESDVSVTLRLPTFFCSPNFAYIMAEDSKKLLSALPEVGNVRVHLENFHVGEEIEAGLESDAGFDATFSEFSETSGEDLTELRGIFKRKAFIRRQEMLCRELLRSGATPMELAHLTLGEVPPSEEREVYLDRRAELGFDTADGSPLLLSMYGATIPEDAVVMHLKNAKLTRISVEGNGMFCQELLKVRYSKERERLGASS